MDNLQCSSYYLTTYNDIRCTKNSAAFPETVQRWQLVGNIILVQMSPCLLRLLSVKMLMQYMFLNLDTLTQRFPANQFSASLLTHPWPFSVQPQAR